MSPNIAQATTPPELPADGKSETTAQVSKSTRTPTELEKLRSRYPEHVRFILIPPVPLGSTDYREFAGLVKLFVELVDVSNPIGLIFVPDIVLSVMDSRRLARFKAQIIDIEQLSILRAQIEEGLLLEGLPDKETVINAALLAKEYFEGAAPWRELTERFPRVYDRDELEAAAYRRRLRDLGRIEQMLKNCEQRRDRALNNLYVLRKHDAQRLREAAHRLESAQTPKSAIEEDIAVPAAN
jgi:hypothetical protein